MFLIKDHVYCSRRSFVKSDKCSQVVSLESVSVGPEEEEVIEKKCMCRVRNK